MNKNSEAMEDSQNPTRSSSSIRTQHEGRDFLAASEKVGTMQQKNPSIIEMKAPAPPLPPPNDTPFFQGELRTGIWTQEEMDYLTALVEAFHAGSLPIPNGTTLRRYIASMLHCSTKRISKKMEGTDYHGRRPFLAKEGLSPEESKALDTKLESLKAKFFQSVEDLNVVQVAAAKKKEENKSKKNVKNTKVAAAEKSGVPRKRAPRYKSTTHKPELEQKQHSGRAEEGHNNNSSSSNPYGTVAMAAGVASASASEASASAAVVSALPVVHSRVNPIATVQRPTNNQDLLSAAAAGPGGNTTLHSGYLEELFSNERFQSLLHNHSAHGGRNVDSTMQPLSTTTATWNAETQGLLETLAQAQPAQEGFHLQQQRPPAMTTSTWSQGMQLLLETLAQVRAQQQTQGALQRQQQQPTISTMRQVDAFAALPSSNNHVGLLASRLPPTHQPAISAPLASSSSSSEIFQRLAASLLTPSNQQQDAASIADLLHQRTAAPPLAATVTTMQLRNLLPDVLFQTTSASRVRPSENSTSASGRLEEPEAKRPRFG